MTQLHTPITIRPAAAHDAPRLAALAILDSAALPAGPVVVAEVDGELRAAVSQADGRAIADPFHPTLDLVELLRARIAQPHRRTRAGGVLATLSAARRDRSARGPARWRAA